MNITDTTNPSPPNKYHNQVGEDDVFMVSDDFFIYFYIYITKLYDSERKSSVRVGAVF